MITAKEKNETKYAYFFERLPAGLLVILMIWRFLTGGWGEAEEAIADACRFGGRPGFLGETIGATWPEAGVDASDAVGLARGRPAFLDGGASLAVAGVGVYVGAEIETSSRVNALATAAGRPRRGRASWGKFCIVRYTSDQISFYLIYSHQNQNHLSRWSIEIHLKRSQTNK